MNLKLLQSIASDISVAMTWSDTPQGYGYWYDVKENIKNIIRAEEKRAKRETISIGDKKYYKDELETALKNINPIL